VGFKLFSTLLMVMELVKKLHKQTYRLIAHISCAYFSESLLLLLFDKFVLTYILIGHFKPLWAV
jgi:hypothetical protein